MTQLLLKTRAEKITHCYIHDKKTGDHLVKEYHLVFMHESEILQHSI